MASSQKKPRVMVTTSYLASLKDSYDRHFSKYCENKKNPVHRIPTVVWKQVYEDFLEEARNECLTNGTEFDVTKLPTERKLQDNLREFLISLGTGTSDVGEGSVTPQNDENLVKIKLTDGHARRNMIGLRDNLLRTDASNVVDANATGTRIERKRDLQQRAADSLEKMTTSITESGTKMTTLLESKLELSTTRSAVQNDYVKLKSLKALLDQKVITQEVYEQKAKQIFNKL
jgi:hypothetical protein